MNKQILKKYKTLGKYHELTTSYNFPPKESYSFYEKNKFVIDFESTMYSQIRHDREILGGNDKIHNLTENERREQR